MPNFVAAEWQGPDAISGYLDLDRVIFAYVYFWSSDPELWSVQVFTEPGANVSSGGYRLHIEESTEAAAAAALQTLLGVS